MAEATFCGLPDPAFVKGRSNAFSTRLTPSIRRPLFISLKRWTLQSGGHEAAALERFYVFSLVSPMGLNLPLPLL